MKVFDQPPRGASPLLFVAGVVLLGSLFLLANTYGNAPFDGWPWEAFRPDGPPLRWGVAALWALTGLVALVTSLLPSFGARASILAVLGAGFVAALALVPSSPFAVAAHVGQLLALAVLAAGLLRSGEADSGGPARAAAACGAVLFLLHVALFASTTELGPVAGLDRVRSDLMHLADEGVGLEDALRVGASGTVPIAVSALLLAAFLGLLAGLGLRAKWLGRIGWLLAVLGLLWPAISEPLVEARLDGATLEAAGRRMLVAHGGALFLLASALVADLLPRRRAA
ncbi:MAG: hypothetical protein AB7T63_10235 [Planctomycetota bacterium]